MDTLKWTIGEVEILQIVELEDKELIQSIIYNATPENIKKIDWLQPHFADENGHLKALVQSFIIKSGGKNILIDTCNGNDKKRPNSPEWANLQTDFLQRMTTVGVKAEDVDIVAFTHLHFDHVGWNTTLKGGKWVPTFPNAKYLFAKAEYEYWKGKPEKEIEDDHLGIADSVNPVVEAGLAEFVDENYKIDKIVSFVNTPGHTPHHVSILIESKGKKAIISGDVTHHPCQIAHPDWGTNVDTFPDQALQTRQKFIADIAGTNTLLIGSHFANPAAGRVVISGSGYVFEVLP